MTVIVTENGKNAKKLDPRDFDSEGELQEYIYENPEALPMYEIDEDIKVLILMREFPTNSGPIDALGVDAYGNIYIVETKLYKNPDKREVVAQVLDYGAAIWSYYNDFTEFISRLDLGTNKKFGVSVHEKIREYFQHTDETQTDELLESMKSNLNKGVFRFVVLMDHLEDRLKDLILFINKNSQFDMYAVEIEYYKFDKHELMIPRIFGTEVKKDLSVGTSSSSSRKKWDLQMFLSELSNNISPTAFEMSKKLYEETTRLGNVSFGTGAANGSYTLKLTGKEEPTTIMHAWSSGRIDLLSGYFSNNILSEGLKETLLKEFKDSAVKTGKHWYRVEIEADKFLSTDIDKLVAIYKDIQKRLLR
ncbi:MAG: hypothetical protein GYA51_08205 [Candidatus Methanofastidiosa archaeon]|nr:hypothetical protein [Candidatus Methanofastidiosa archaeon]